jgi:hypothetical protein
MLMLVGQQVVCVEDCVVLNNPEYPLPVPIKGEIYTIAAVYVASDLEKMFREGPDPPQWTEAIQLKEVSIQVIFDDGKTGYDSVSWEARRFRLVESTRNERFAVLVESVRDIACACGAAEQHANGKLYATDRDNYPKVYARAFELL